LPYLTSGVCKADFYSGANHPPALRVGERNRRSPSTALPISFCGDFLLRSQRRLQHTAISLGLHLLILKQIWRQVLVWSGFSECMNLNVVAERISRTKIWSNFVSIQGPMAARWGFPSERNIPFLHPST